MKKLLKRYDVFLTILFFLLAIPAAHYEFFSLLEDQTLSFRHILRMSYGNQKAVAPGNEVVLINTDEAFFRDYKSFPLRRTDIAKIAANVRKLGAKVVALDILMDFPSSYGEDEPTAKMLQEAGNVLVVSQAEIAGGGQFRRLNYPTKLIQNVTRSGYTNISSFSSVATSMNRLRVFPEITRQPDGWPFAVQAIAMFLGVQPRLEGNTLKIGDTLTIPLDHFNSFFIDFPRLVPGVKYLSQVPNKGRSALEFLDLTNQDVEELEYFVKDKIVLVGDTSEVSHDWFDTPVGTVYGVEIIADTINTLLKGAPLRKASLPLEILAALTVMLGLLLAGQFQHPAIRWMVTLLLFSGYVAVVTMQYVTFGVVFSMSYVLVAGLLGFMIINLRAFLLERGQKTMIKSAFGQYLSPKVVDILVKDPSKLSLGGEQREMTAFFSDVAGFSSISEKLTPTELVQLLNEYLTAMCNIISGVDGTVDKFEGDAIIAFWGAPLDQPDHAKLACYASIDMQKHMVQMRERLASEGRPPMKVRIGLNSGPMVVGNMGSAQRMDYTIMGDAVNLAARLEGANKFYATSTMLSQFTYEQAKDYIDARQLDIVRVVGKKEPVGIYELLDRKGAVTGALADCVAQYNKGLERYRARDFAGALQEFTKALTIRGDDGPSLTYQQRCQEYLQTPPPADWDGVYQFTSKG
ncbi:MAG: adenylate/guanylate cyclase domain-containing protein [Magnetococcales bacterium]|nr:adenylate/guanylate cyclase domain-containing protein [Magnetococcales bacterium]